MLADIPYWYWLIGGFLLLSLEMLVPGIFLLWVGLAAVVTGVINSFVPMSPPIQLLVFGVLSLISVGIGYKFRQKRTRNGGGATLNASTTTTMVGKTYTLTEDMQNGRGQLQIGDSWWSVVADEDFPKDTKIKVVKAESATLHIEKVDD